MRNLLLIGLIIFSVACKNKEQTAKKGNKENQVTYFNEKDSTVINAGIQYTDDIPSVKSDPITIEKALIREGKLLLTIQYGGGCKNHEIGILANNIIMKSMPAKRAIKLYHNGNEDMCKALVKKNIAFDISELRYKKDDKIILILDGWKKPLEVEFN